MRSYNMCFVGQNAYFAKILGDFEKLLAVSRYGFKVIIVWKVAESCS